MELFFGKAKCSQCHSGKLFTDQKFHSIALPQFGPGRTRIMDPFVRDVGRMGETDNLDDAYRFRTQSLRNVALTAPYGHNGSYATLDGIIRHHLDPINSLENWDPSQVILPEAEWLEDIDFVVLEDRLERERLKSRIDIEPIDLTDEEVCWGEKCIKKKKSVKVESVGPANIIPVSIIAIQPTAPSPASAYPQDIKTCFILFFPHFKV